MEVCSRRRSKIKPQEGLSFLKSNPICQPIVRGDKNPIQMMRLRSFSDPFPARLERDFLGPRETRPQNSAKDAIYRCPPRSRKCKSNGT